MICRELHRKNHSPGARLFCLALLTLAHAIGCSRSDSESRFQQSQMVSVSPSCGVVLDISRERMFGLARDHHTGSGPTRRVRCPGFFALTPDLSQSDAPNGFRPVIETKRQQFLAEPNNCNQTGPTSPLPSPDPNPSEKIPKDKMIAALLAKTEPNRLVDIQRAMSNKSLWNTRFEGSSDPRIVPRWIMEKMKAIAARRTDIRIGLIEHNGTQQPSVEAIIPGSGPNRDKYVVLGGHEDSIHQLNSSRNPDAYAPGADDNASGIAVLLEIFRVLVESEFQPDATIAFYAYAAEEVGLVGSQEIAKSYKDSSRQVLGVLQYDMASYTSGPTDELMFMTDYTSPELTQIAAQLARSHLGMKVSYDTCGYACSDHASWNRQDFHTILPAEKEAWTSAERIHTEKDIIDSLIQSSYMDKFAKLGLAFTITLGY